MERSGLPTFGCFSSSAPALGDKGSMSGNISPESWPGDMMLSPMIVSLPFKLMLFVLVDGWNLIFGTLATSFGMGV